MAHGGSRKGAGRKKGVPNYSGKEGADFAQRVYERIRSVGTSEEQISQSLLTCGIPAVIQREHSRLQAYKWGMPAQRNQHEGTPDGDPIKVVVEHIGSPYPASAKAK